jgi:8-oxo-dGTP pyrophosphatase MutT (NUDIX family)
MFHLIPAPLHRTGLRVANALRKRWWRIRKPHLLGCRVLAFDSAGRVLLIRHSYGSHLWMPPGGGIGRGEHPLAAAARELREETGCRIDDACEVGLLDESLQGARNTVHIVAGWTADTPRPDGREVMVASFFAPDDLPDDMPAFLRDGLPQWITAAKAARPGRSPAPHPVPPPAPRG